MARRVPVTKGRDNLGRDTLSYELRKGWRVTFAVSRAQTGFIVERLVLELAGDCPPGGIIAALIGALTLGSLPAYLPRTMPARRRQLPRSRVDYPRLYARHMALLRAGVHQDIDKALAAEFGKNRSTIRSQLHRAKAAGFFDQTIQAQPAVMTLSKRQLREFRKRNRSARDSAHR
jgi:hypothetical protein